MGRQSSSSRPFSPSSRASSTNNSSTSSSARRSSRSKGEGEQQMEVELGKNVLSSPTSILQQWRQDCKGAMEDAYSNYILGDETGESARLVLVAIPSDDIFPNGGEKQQERSGRLVFSDNNGNPRSFGTTSYNHNATGASQTIVSAHSSSHTFGPIPNNHHSAPTLLQVANSRKPTTSFRSCGVTFVEINGRAYVQALETSSAAYQAGVLPEDCVQYAAVLAKEWEEPLEGDFATISQQALEREDKGQRITFSELKRVLLHGSGVLQQLALAEETANHCHDDPHSMGPSSDVPTTIRIGKGTNKNHTVINPCGPLTVQDMTYRRRKRTTRKSKVQEDDDNDDDDDDDDDDMLNPMTQYHQRNTNAATIATATNGSQNSGDEPRPVVLVFRRTRQRPPRAWNVWPNYRLDDECDVACHIVKSLANTSAITATTTFSTSTTTESSHNDKESLEGELNVEASTIRGMIHKAVGLAFVRSNKVVFGVSLAGGTGIVVSRLSDGTWSAPSCISMMGVGLGLQVGMEVANYIFILQTKEALEHFQRGGSFTIGANVGAAFAGIGREAVGAASVSTALCGMAAAMPVVKEDEYTFEDGGADGRVPGKAVDGVSSSAVTPIVAYAKSEGLYLGISLEGSRIFTRNELNARAYKFSSYKHKAVSAQEILTGKIQQRPMEAESLYALLHAIELTHELSSLPPLPRCKFLVDRTTTKRKDGSKAKTGGDWAKPWNASSPPYLKNEEGDLTSAAERDMENDNDDDDDDDDLDRVLMQDEIYEFNEKFQDFLFGGLTVNRVAPHKRERRTLWLYAALEGSLRMGFVSKNFSLTSRTTHLSTSIIQDVTPKAGISGGGGSSTISDMEGDEVTLDSALMDNQSLLTTTGTLREKVELSKKLSMDLVDVTCLSQNVPTNIKLRDSNERRRLICVESQDGQQLVFLCRSIEETRLLFCGLKLLLEKETARLGVRGGRGKRGIPSALKNKGRSSSKQFQSSRKSSGYASSEIDDTEDLSNANPSYPTIAADYLPEGWKSWGRLPCRAYMRQQAASNEEGYPTYVHGQLLVRDICKNVHLPLPLPLCRVLLLDSSSPVISRWETDRGDLDFERTPWTFPPATPREMEQFQSEHQLIASGSMCGAHRTISYEKYRNGQLVRLSETHIVDSDDTEQLVLQVTERLPRRGFSIKVKILLRAVDNGDACEATVLGEIRPVGKNMSDPAAVHKALLLVLDELRNRYATESVGLLAGFKSVVEGMAKGEGKGLKNRASASSRYSTRITSWEEKKENEPTERTSVVKFEDVMNAEKNLGVADGPDSKSWDEKRPQNMSGDSRYKASRKSKSKKMPIEDSFTSQSSEPVTIEVKPLPKIRLSLMPSPREEDEENLDEDDEPKSKPKSSKSKSLSSRKAAWSKNRHAKQQNV